MVYNWKIKRSFVQKTSPSILTPSNIQNKSCWNDFWLHFQSPTWGQRRLWVHWGPGAPGRGLRCFQWWTSSGMAGGLLPVFPMGKVMVDMGSVIFGSSDWNPSDIFPGKWTPGSPKKITPSRQEKEKEKSSSEANTDPWLWSLKMWAMKKKASGCWGYMGDYTIQLNGDYFMNHLIRIPVLKQPVCHGK